jgi:putative RecB family exonuclease
MTCPRQFEFDYIHELEGADRTDMERYFDRGSVLDTALQRTADAVSTETDAETVQLLARENFAEEWASTTAADNYPSPAAYEYDRQLSKAAIEDYLDPQTDGEGIIHLQRSVGTEVHLEWTDDELGAMHGYADNIVRTQDGFLIIDYKASYSSRRFPNKSGSDLEKQFSGTGHYPSRLKKWLQIGMYWAGLREHELYSPGDEIQFMFYGLIGSKSRTPTADGYTVSVSGKEWDMTDLYREYQDELWAFISDSIAGIQAEAFDPTEETWELIQEEACGGCDYQPACGDSLTEKVRFS